MLEECHSDDEANSDEDFEVKKCEIKLKKTDVIGPVAASADRLNLSCRAMAMSSACTEIQNVCH